MTIYEKLFKIQQTVKATKSQYNSFGKYSYRSAEGIIEDIKPILAESKTVIVLSDRLEGIEGRFYVKADATLVDIESGEVITATAYAREAESKKGMDEAQITGAASSYARKYALSGLLLLDDNKDADTEEYQNNGKNEAVTEAVSPVPPVPKQDEPLNQTFICTDCHKPIMPYMGYPAESVVKKTKAKYGVMLCMDCSAVRRAKEEKKNS